MGDFFLALTSAAAITLPTCGGPGTHRRSTALNVGGRGEAQNKTSLIKEHNSFLFLVRGRPNQIRPAKAGLISRGADGPRGKFNSMCGLSAMMCVFSVQMVQLGFVIHILTFHFTPPAPSITPSSDTRPLSLALWQPRVSLFLVFSLLKV